MSAAVPYLGGVRIGHTHHYGKRLCKPYAALVNSRFHVCTSLTPRPMTMIFSLGNPHGSFAEAVKGYIVDILRPRSTSTRCRCSDIGIIISNVGVQMTIINHFFKKGGCSNKLYPELICIVLLSALNS